MLEVRTPDGRLYQRATEQQAQALVASRLADEVRSPGGKLRYLSLRAAVAGAFVSTVAADSVTTTGATIGRREAREHHFERSRAYRRERG